MRLKSGKTGKGIGQRKKSDLVAKVIRDKVQVGLRLGASYAGDLGVNSICVSYLRLAFCTAPPSAVSFWGSV